MELFTIIHENALATLYLWLVFIMGASMYRKKWLYELVVYKDSFRYFRDLGGEEDNSDIKIIRNDADFLAARLSGVQWRNEDDRELFDITRLYSMWVPIGRLNPLVTNKEFITKAILAHPPGLIENFPTGNIRRSKYVDLEENN